MKQVYHLLASFSFLLFSLNSGFSQITCINPSVKSIHTGNDAGYENYYLQFSVSVTNPDGLASTTVKVADPDANEYSLFDDGLHQDNVAGDGIYGNYFDKGTTTLKTGAYVFTISDNDETLSETDVLDLVLDYPRNFYPAENSIISMNPSFSWLRPEGVSSFEVKLYNDSHEQIWNSTGKGSTCTYNGPALTDGNKYYWKVEYSSQDALSYRESYFIYNSSLGIPQIETQQMQITHYGNDSGDDYFVMAASCRVTDPQGLSDIDLVTLTDPAHNTLRLFDDGKGDDLIASDGRYSCRDTIALLTPGIYYFTVTDKAGNTSQFNTIHDPIMDFPKNLQPTNKMIVQQNPVFTWDPVDGASSYSIQVYDENNLLWSESTSETSIAYNNGGWASPLEVGSEYKWNVTVSHGYTVGFHEYLYFTYNGDAEKPQILTTSSLFNNNQDFYNNQEIKLKVFSKVYDPQGISNIQSVVVTNPDNNSFNLYQGSEQPVDVFYNTMYYSQLPPSGNYIFNVTDQEGHVTTVTHNIKILDLPKNTRPCNHAIVTLSQPVFQWDPVADCDYYNVYIQDEFGNRVWSYHTTDNSARFNIDGYAVPLIKGRSYLWSLEAGSTAAYSTIQSIFTYSDADQADSLALVALYNSTNGPGWNRNDNWLTGPLSTWYGVTVENNRVTRLDLFQNNLNGRIPEEIGWLTGLNSLQMGLNNFNGSVIPNQIGNLINLNYLDFYSSNIGGSLPVEIGSLNNLQQLQLSHNSLSGPIPAEIGNLSNLRNFYLHENQFSGNIPATIGNLSQLNSLLLFQNSLSGSIPATLCNLMNLERLYLNNNQLTGEIPSEIGNLNTLMELSLGFNQLSGSIPPEIGNLSNLNYVILSDNYFSGSVPNSIQSLSKLFLLFLHNNQLTDMPDLGMLDKLDYLYIYNNRLDFDDIEPNVGVPNIVFGYVPQQPVGDFQFYTINEGDAITLSVSVGGSHNVYQWYRDGIWLEGKNSNTLVINKATSDQTGSYVCYITNTVATDLTLYSNPIYLTVFETTHFVPVWQGTTGLDHMNFYASKAQIDGTDMQPGDEIGIFDGEICVGTATVVSIVDNMNMLEIRISKDDPYTPQTDGYTEGHQATFKIWDDRKQSEISNVSVIYLSGNDIFTAGASSFVEIRGIGLATQEIELQAGWNIFSLDVTPENISMMNILQPLITSGALMKVQSETGSAIEPIPGSSLWIDNIGNWSVTEGYKIRLNKPETLVVMGAPVQGTVNINLQTGWNIMSYPFATSQDAMGALNSIILNGHLMKVQNESGAAIEPLPAGMGWINNIGTFLPGEGYKIRVSANDILSLSENTSSFEGDLKSAKDVHTPQYFRPVWTNNGLDHMNVYVSGSFQQGDEIAVYDGDICVGALKINHTGSDYYSIPISVDDPESFETDGFTTGNSLTIRMWNALSGTETNPEFSILHGYTNTMEPMGTTFADIKQTGNQTILGNNYPNPFRTETIIPFTLAENNWVEISIFNLMGQKITTLVSADLKADSYHVTWNGTYGSGEKAPSGIYLCKMTVGQQVIVNRIEITD